MLSSMHNPNVSLAKPYPRVYLLRIKEVILTCPTTKEHRNNVSKPENSKLCEVTTKLNKNCKT